MCPVIALLLAEYLAAYAVGLDMRGRSFVNLALAYPVYRSGSSFAKALATGRLIAIARICLDAEDAFAAFKCLKDVEDLFAQKKTQ